jgi:hypothetical protein
MSNFDLTLDEASLLTVSHFRGLPRGRFPRATVAGAEAEHFCFDFVLAAAAVEYFFLDFFLAATATAVADFGFDFCAAAGECC